MKSSIYVSSQTSELELVANGASSQEDFAEEAGLHLIEATAAPYSPQTVLRVFDLVLSVLLLLILWPLFVIFAVAIRLDTPGPVLFIQNRVGKDGKEFPFFKFRSMVTDAEAKRRALEQHNERSGPVFKMRDDPRITRVGRILRRSSLDELPQILNVLRGEMSLVGPRPALPREVALYTPEQLKRLAVTPGVTGLWQVSGRAELSFEESIRMDLFYVQNHGPFLYMKILLLTIPAVLSARGAY